MKKLITLFFLLSLNYTLFANLRINELMQSNVTTIMDDLNDFPDSWVELYNEGSEIENLADYKIGIKKKVDNAYALPDSLINPQEYVLIYCDKVAMALHTDFRLESNKEGTVYLFKNSEQIQKVDHPAFPDVDISYGLDPINDEWGYFLQATPGNENKGPVCDSDNILPHPEISHTGGIFYSPISVSLMIPEGSPENCEIRYTLNGEVPTADSPLYEGEELEISATTTLRASLFCEGWLSRFPVTHSYLFPDHYISLPVVSVVTDNSYFYDKQLGIYVKFDKDWRRPINFEYYKNDDTDFHLNQLVECRIAGNFSSGHPLKPLAIYANKRFGVNRLNCEFFPDLLPGVTNFKSILLRNSANDFYEAYMRDAVVQENVGNNMEIDYQAVSSCVLYINGIYKGIMHIRERSNEDYVFTHYDELEEIDMVENMAELKEGRFEEFDSLMDFIGEEGHSAEEFSNLVDVKEILDVHLANIYYNNCDFPGNNTVFWKPQSEDGKWRMILKDTDYSMGLKHGNANGNPPEFKTLDWLYNPGYPGANEWGNRPKHTSLYRSLLNNTEILNDYIDRSFIYMGDFLNSRETIKVINKRFNLISEEWQYHSQLYQGKDGFVIDENSLAENVDYMKGWITQRDTFFPQYFADFYELGKLAYLDIISNKDSMANLKMNNIPLKTYEFHGFFPVNKLFTINYDTSYDMKGWEVYLFDSDYKDTDLATLIEIINTETNLNPIIINSSDFSFSIPEEYERVLILTQEPVRCKSLTLNIESAELNIGETVQLEATVLPEDTTDKTVVWNSSDENVATVDESGLLTAVSEGHAVITASCGEITAECEITVLTPIVEAEQILLNIESAELNVGETVQFEATVLPEDTTNKTVVWNSSDENVATIDESGLLTAVSEGHAVITASCGEVTAECGIIVLEEAGIESLLDNPENEISIYSTDGILIRKDCKVEELKTLTKGIYIIISGKEHYKISI